MRAELPKFLDELGAGGEVVIVRNGQPVGRLVPPVPPKGVMILGRGKGKLISYIEDDEHLKNFEDYMP